MATTESATPTSQHREKIYAVFADRTTDFDETAQQALEIATDALDTDTGFITRIHEGTQRITHATNSETSIQLGASCPLDEAYCRRTIQREDPLVVQDSYTSESIDDAAIERFGLGCYIGTKIVVDDETYGTLCFAGVDPREESFTHAETMFVELLARLISQAIERREYERELEAHANQLKEQKERFQDIAETTFDIIYRIGLQAQFTYVSSASERIIGYHPDELVGEPFGEFIEESSLNDTLDAFQHVLQGGSVENFELEFRTKSGERAVLEINVRPVFDDGEIVEIQGVARDITQRVEQEQKLELRNRAIEDSQLGITISEITDGEESIVFANSAFEALTGYDKAEILGGDHGPLVGERTDSDVITAFRQSLQQGESATVEVVNYRKDGTPYWTQLSGSPVLNEEGALTHAIQFHQNITERERTRRLIDLFNRLHRHNLRNELNVILGYAELAGDTDSGEYSQEQADAASTIHKTAKSLLAYTERIRELEQYTHQERRPTRIDPERMLSRIVETFRASFPESTVEFSVETCRDICAGDELERAVLELVRNAFVHNDQPTHVEIRVTEAGDHIEIEVVDDGDGISAQEVGYIDTGKETELEHGSGVGLWFVNWIVTRYGGSFQLRPGKPGNEDDTDGTIATILIRGIHATGDIRDTVQPPTPLFR